MNCLLIVNGLLRVIDNPLLVRALTHKGVIAYYALNTTPIELHGFSFPNKSAASRLFELQSLQDLQLRLEQLGIPLIISNEGSSKIIELIKAHRIETIYALQSSSSEELALLAPLKNRDNLSIVTDHSDLLYDINTLPFSIDQLPEVFTAFRKKVERYSIPSPVNRTELIPVSKPVSIQSTPIPSLENLGYQSYKADPRSAHPFEGGETAGWSRLRDYFWNTERVATYKQTRNGLHGLDFSSKLSAYLALGCISVRSIYEELKAFESSVIENEDTYWLFFELLWREYFKLIGFRHGNQIFKLGGILDRNYTWKNDQGVFIDWINGTTKDGLVNAAMIELRITGWMSNRARQNAASYWSKTLGQDWRVGAYYFQSQLIDYDPQVNWGNWCYVSGVGNDPRDRIFNTARQAQMYDPDYSYRKLWNT